jgi:3-methyl-2-oxobutanoate hydroxymethyltransferase
LKANARALADAGVFAIVVELVPAVVGRDLTRSVFVPTIGIGAGPHCDGQVLVWHDLLGMGAKRKRFVKVYAQLDHVITDAIRRYAADVRTGRFPGRRHSFTLARKRK